MDPREAFPKFEMTPKWAFMYAHHILHARWPEGESTIAQDAYYACCYAINVLNGRFPLGEEAIMHSSHAEYYKCNFMWKEKADWIVEGF